MEFVIRIGVSVVTKMGECSVSSLGRQLGYLYYYKSNIEKLETQAQDLKNAKERVKHLVENAKRKGEEIENHVQQWFSTVDVISEEVESFLKDKVHANTGCCSNGSSLNLVSRYRLGRKAKKMTQKVVEIKDSACSDNISYVPVLQSSFPNKGFMAFDTRNSTMMGIMNALVDINVGIIGVYGMAGVGKTTLVKEVARRALEEKLFDDVALIVVSHTPDLVRIQQEIADKLGLVFHEISISARADRLRHRLRNEEKFLVILDDIWKELDLVDIGITFEDDQNGCKILMTSRFKDVLSNRMSEQKNFPVELLSENEAWDWFRKIVGDPIKNSDIQLLATQIVEECGCLPIAIVTVGHALKTESLSSWNDAFRQLQRSNPTNIEGMNEKVYSSIKLSYDFLGSEEAKSLLLLCCLHKEDANIGIEDLLRYVMGWGLFQDVYKMDEARDRLQIIVEKLKARCLLLDGDYHDTVKLHDIIRDVCISIASVDRHMYNIRSNDDLKERLNKKKLKDSTAISLLCENVGYLPEKLECAKLHFFWMWKIRHLQIPDHFFEETKELRILDLSYSYLGVLPSSFCFLQNLQALCLRDCWLRDLTSIAELKNLEVLDLSRSSIEELPRQIGQLTRLRLLDLTSCSRLKVIEPNILSSLIHLEELYMKKSFSKWEAAGLSELKNLVHLTTLHLEIANSNILPNDLFHDKLERFKILIGNLSGWSDCGTSRMLKLINFTKNSLSEEHGLQRLLKRSKELYLDGLKGVENIVHELDWEGFPEVKHFSLKNNGEIRYFIDSEDQPTPSVAFPSVESFTLRSMMKLEKICNGKLTKESFGKLKFLEVSYCYQLKNLFSFSIAKGLLLLKDIEVTYCSRLEEIITCNGEHDAYCVNGTEEVDNIKFSQLCSLRLRDLPKFLQVSTCLNEEQLTESSSSTMSFFNDTIISFPILETLELSLVNVGKIWDNGLTVTDSTCFQNLVTLNVNNCGFLKNLFPSSVAANLLQLKRLVVMMCDMMEEIISTDEVMDKKFKFPRLNSLTIRGLEKLTKFCSATFVEFPLLTELIILRCPALKTFNSYSAENHDALSLFNENVAFPSLKTMEIGSINKPNRIWSDQLTEDSFCKLEDVEFTNCRSLTSIFPSGMLRRLCSLTTSRVSECHMVKEIFEIPIADVQEESKNTHSQLSNLHLFKLPSLKHVWGKDPRGILTCPNIQKLYIYECPNLQHLFPYSVAKSLLKLEILCVIDCGIKEIVAEEEGLVKMPKFVFPQLTDLRLVKVHQLVRFYPGPHTSEWPLLNWLVVSECIVEVLALECQSFLKTYGLAYHGVPLEQRHLFLIDKVAFPRLEKLKLERILLSRIWDDEHEGLVGKEEWAQILSHVRELKLSDLSNLMYLWEESTQPCTAYKNLNTLEVINCGRLKKLVPSSVSLQNLVNLIVSDCSRMVYLLSSSTAKSLTKLKKMSISRCEMMEGITSTHEEGNDDEGEIVFDHLKVLELNSLPALTMFYPGNYEMSFPNMEEIVVRQCREMQTFCHGVISTPKLHKLLIDEEDENSSESDAEWDDEYEELFPHRREHVRFTEDVNSIILQHWNSKHGIGMELQQMFTEQDDQIDEEHSDGNSYEDYEHFMSTRSPEGSSIEVPHYEADENSEESDEV
ncbi:probable disease resistance protein At4g27220 isoform X2 [Ziziphus jujuba]|uniref:Probable disease resistance protein At4g27220 isoform X2 n=1 Tax=Ziziphus jujuba TaxID=326968 RepID=A0ABM4A6Z6_ZIZJJ|nr:probable disease resistance protein At4g27220 isoform X2 [Ziziphus jujuba]